MSGRVKFLRPALPMKNEKCMAYAVLLSVILDRESEKKFKISIDEKCIKKYAQQWLILPTLAG